jgi:hypothetical protein
MDPANYQRIRLWAGITSIGANLALIWGLSLSAAWWAAGVSGTLTTSVLLLAVALLITAANLPFDMLTGSALERAAGRIQESTSEHSTPWLKDWIHYRTQTAAGLWIGMLFFAGIHQATGFWAVAMMLAAGLLILTLFLVVPAGHSSSKGSSEQMFEKNLESELKSLGVSSRPVRWFDHGDSETVNGCITPLGYLSLSTTVAQWLTPREAALMAAREECYRRSGTWIVILGIVLVWTFLGILLIRLLPGVNPVQEGLYGAAVMSSWCFVALFVWPSVNRIWMRNEDEFLAALTSAKETRDLLSKIERLNATDIALPPVKTMVFHPIPPLQDRLNELS